MNTLINTIAYLWNSHTALDSTSSFSIRKVFHTANDILSLFDTTKPIIIDDLSYLSMNGRHRDYDYAKKHIFKQSFTGIIKDNIFYFTLDSQTWCTPIICCKSNIIVIS